MFAEGRAKRLKIPGTERDVIVEKVNYVHCTRKKFDPDIPLARSRRRAVISVMVKGQRFVAPIPHDGGGTLCLIVVASINDQNQPALGARLRRHTLKGLPQFAGPIPRTDYDRLGCGMEFLGHSNRSVCSFWIELITSQRSPTCPG
jgi:hypothetical protein